MSTTPTPIPAGRFTDLVPPQPANQTDALNRYRIAHPDREVKTVIRRLTRLPLLAAQPVPDDSAGLDHAQELAYERELVRLEVDKWRLGVERTVVSVRTLERQRESYLSKTAETGACGVRGKRSQADSAFSRENTKAPPDARRRKDPP